jgi:hypothetical protein
MVGGKVVVLGAEVLHAPTTAVFALPLKDATANGRQMRTLSAQKWTLQSTVPSMSERRSARQSWAW